MRPFHIIILAGLLFSLQAQSQIKFDKFNRNPDSLIAYELHNKRAVMLGDFVHNASFSLITPVKVLRKWLNSTVELKKYDCPLTLILEMSERDALAIERYISDGNMDTLLLSTGMSRSIENIEFYDDLRKFSLSVDSINSKFESNISFKLKGFEVDANEFFDKMSEEQIDRWFISKRDTNLSVSILQYMNENPKEEILIFYGNGHLQNGFVKKDVRNVKDSVCGYFLAHYLKNYFGDNNLFTVNQTATRQMLGDRFIYQDINTDFFIKSTDIWPRDTFELRFDGVIYRPLFKFCLPHPLGKMLCMNLSEIMLKNLDMLHTIGDRRVMQLLNNQLTDFYFGLHFTKFDEYSIWLSQNIDRYNIDSISNLGRVFSYMLLRYRDNKDFVLSYFQEFGLMEDQILPFDTLNWNNQRWPQGLTHIKFFNSITCLWFGYPDEKARAKDYLIEFSGQDFDSPQKYLQWYRNKYYGYDF